MSEKKTPLRIFCLGGLGRNVASCLMGDGVPGVECLESGSTLPKVQGAEIFLLVAGLGRETGTRLLLEMARSVREMGGLTVAVVSTPFHFERPLSHETARSALEMVRLETDAVRTVSLACLADEFKMGVTLREVFWRADREMSRQVRAVSARIENAGSFSEVRALLQGFGKSTMEP